MLIKNITYSLVLILLMIYGCNKPKNENENTASQIDSVVTGKDSIITTGKSGYTLLQTDSVVVVKNNLTQEIDTIFVNQHESGVDSTYDKDELSYENYFNSTYEVISLVGHYLSYEYSYEGSGGAHPIYGAYYRTIDIPTKEEVCLDSLFDSDVIYHALLQDSLIVRSMTNRNSKNLQELVSSLEGGCEISFYDLLKSFAIKSINSRKVEIEFGLTHGCEVMRGNFTTMTINLPVSLLLSQYLSK
jgi:hypothetical protein